MMFVFPERCGGTYKRLVHLDIILEPMNSSGAVAVCSHFDLFEHVQFLKQKWLKRTKRVPLSPGIDAHDRDEDATSIHWPKVLICTYEGGANYG